ncbi:hypothetical protein [Clostridium estertheticum]|uniref:hypothetical protein n=1 Tax=Clostridium estertheticum TaxID=238834 RepID=UPI001CF10999|nr:hypothetical protein [Clostridium estertheticum]MCB2357085.1 hypothetical protein [Clostridium estertheticum]WAG43788.1 hypothetical protein LL065_24230 [Clostridium estertheticum]
MGQPKKLKLTMDKLIEIAIEINKNTIANRNRSKDDKIPTDKLIRGFGINRKNFSVTIQDTDIKYNKSTFLYDIPSEFITNNKSDTIVIDSETNVKTVNKPNNDSETLESPKSEIIVSPQSETIVSLSKTDLESFDKRIKSIEEMKYEFEEMNNWYREQRKKENIIDIEIPEIKIDKKWLKEDPSTRGFKVYPSVIAKFKEFSKENNQYTMQDLMAMALLEYIDKYKK